ncbi:hypothetical protein D3C85_1564890 [compost metagenome]
MGSGITMPLLRPRPAGANLHSHDPNPIGWIDPLRLAYGGPATQSYFPAAQYFAGAGEILYLAGRALRLTAIPASVIRGLLYFHAALFPASC